MFWKRHVDQLRSLDDTPRNVSNSEMLYPATDANEETSNGSPSDSDNTSSDSTQAEQNQTSAPATPSSVSVRRYPIRTRRPPKRYQTD